MKLKDYEVNQTIERLANVARDVASCCEQTKGLCSFGILGEKSVQLTPDGFNSLFDVYEVEPFTTSHDYKYHTRMVDDVKFFCLIKKEVK